LENVNIRYAQKCVTLPTLEASIVPSQGEGGRISLLSASSFDALKRVKAGWRA
jgi:hypothetical protein